MNPPRHRGDLAEPPFWLRSWLFCLGAWAAERWEPVPEDVWKKTGSPGPTPPQSRVHPATLPGPLLHAGRFLICVVALTSHSASVGSRDLSPQQCLHM